jgi:hypothetical protein
MFRIILCLSLGLLFTVPAHATNYYNGYVESGYTWKDGYWWLNGQAYSRAQVKCYTGHCRYHWQWQYYPVSFAAKAKAAYISSSEDNWRGKLMDAVAVREQYEARAKASALEHNEFLEAIHAVGFGQGDGYSTPYATGAAYRSSLNGPYADQGSTVYGKSVERIVANYYNPTNLDVQWNQADRHVDKAQDHADNAVHNFRETLREAYSQESTARERIAAIYAKADLLKAADTPEITIAKETITSEERPADSVSRTDVLAVIQAKCINCHSAQEPSGGIDMSKYLAFDEPTKERVRLALTHPDPEKRMPKRKDGVQIVPGEPLGFKEMAAFAE